MNTIKKIQHNILKLYGFCKLLLLMLTNPIGNKEHTSRSLKLYVIFFFVFIILFVLFAINCTSTFYKIMVFVAEIGNNSPISFIIALNLLQ